MEKLEGIRPLLTEVTGDRMLGGRSIPLTPKPQTPKPLTTTRVWLINKELSLKVRYRSAIIVNMKNTAEQTPGSLMSAQQHMTASLGRAPPRLQQPSSLPASSGCDRGDEITYHSPVRWTALAPQTEIKRCMLEQHHPPVAHQRYIIINEELQKVNERLCEHNHGG